MKRVRYDPEARCFEYSRWFRRQKIPAESLSQITVRSMATLLDEIGFEAVANGQGIWMKEIHDNFSQACVDLELEGRLGSDWYQRAEAGEVLTWIEDGENCVRLRRVVGRPPHPKSLSLEIDSQDRFLISSSPTRGRGSVFVCSVMSPRPDQVRGRITCACAVACVVRNADNMIPLYLSRGRDLKMDLQFIQTGRVG